MTLNQTNGTKRRKAVWGPKRTLIAGALALVFGFAPNATAEKYQPPRIRHHRKLPTVNPGEPGRGVKNYRLDDVVEQRKKANPLYMSRVIVTLSSVPVGFWSRSLTLLPFGPRIIFTTS